MARIRSIKPDFYRHEGLQDLELANPGKYPMLVFQGLWGHCDSKGRFEWRPRQLKLDILPFLPFDMAEALAILVEAGMVKRYTIGGKEYAEIPSFEKHQRLSGKEVTDGEKYPEPIREAPVKKIGSVEEIPGAQEGKGREEEGEGRNTSSPAGDSLTCPVEKIVDAYHRLMPNNPRCKVLNAGRRGIIKARWMEASRFTCHPFGYKSSQDGLVAWEEFFAVCAESEFLTGRAQPQPGKPPFMADIDFLMSPSGFAKCIENKYHRRAA